MTEKSPYSSPELVELGGAAELTERIKNSIVADWPGSGDYYDASKEDEEAAPTEAPAEPPAEA